MKQLLVLMATLLLASCMRPSEMLAETSYQLGDAGLLDHHQLERSTNIRIESDSLIYIAQSFFPPVANQAVPDTVLVDETFHAFVQYFPHMRRSLEPLGLEQATLLAHAERADFLLYTRMALSDERKLRDRAVIQFMLYELGSGKMIDHGTFQIRAGLLSASGKQPQDYLRKPMQEYARKLLGLGR